MALSTIKLAKAPNMQPIMAICDGSQDYGSWNPASDMLSLYGIVDYLSDILAQVSVSSRARRYDEAEISTVVRFDIHRYHRQRAPR